MDMTEIQKLGAAPLKPWLDKVEKVTDHESLSKSLVQMAIADMNLFWSWWVDSDSEDASVYSFFLAQGGITMPDRDYYLTDTPEMRLHRQRYTEMSTAILQLAGLSQIRTRTHTYIHTHTHTHSLTHSLSRARALPLSHSLSHVYAEGLLEKKAAFDVACALIYVSLSPYMCVLKPIHMCP
jgi:predicted metalloendopeptidase